MTCVRVHLSTYGNIVKSSGLGARIREEDMHDDGHPGSDGTHERITGAVHDYDLVTFLLLLKFESD
jgi:hypothetical protein